MSSLKAVKGKFYRGLIYGNTATSQGNLSDPLHTHTWTLFLRGKYNEDLSSLVSKVVFVLHESFDPATRGNVCRLLRK